MTAPAEDDRSAGDEAAAVIALIEDPATHGGAEVERVDTHVSHVFLAGDAAWKLKRRIATNFLDFTTPERREAACRRELEVNAAAGDLYLGVVPVVRRDGALHLGGEGEAVDWLVRMRRFDRDGELDRLAERGALDIGLAERLADVVAGMHLAAPRTPEFGGAERVLATVEQIAEAIAAAPRAAPLGPLIDGWAMRARAEVARLGPRLDARRRHGRVRRTHGDLHLGNIVMIDGTPTPFDALEFNEEMASTDVLYDAAFTIMDMQERGLAAEAAAFLFRYLSATRDHSGLALLPLFVSMRAAVRALVAAMREAPDPAEPDAEERLRFALSTLRDRPAPRVIAVGGLSGSGKSTLARCLAPRVGAVVLRSDLARKRMFGVAPEERLPDAAYAPEARARVYARLAREAGRVLRAGFPVLLDAAFLSAEERALAADVAARAGVPMTGLWLEVPAAELRRRVAARTGDPSDAGPEVLEAQLARDPGPGDWTPVRADAPPEVAAGRLLSALADRGAWISAA